MVRVVRNDGAGIGIQEPLHAESSGDSNGLRLFIGPENHVPEGAGYAVVFSRIDEMVVEVMEAGPASVPRVARVGVNAAVQEFVGDIGANEARGEGQAHGLVCQNNRNWSEHGHEADGGESLANGWREVISFGVMTRMFGPERCSSPKASTMSSPAMNDVFEQRPSKDAQES